MLTKNESTSQTKIASRPYYVAGDLFNPIVINKDGSVEEAELLVPGLRPFMPLINGMLNRYSR